MLVKNQRRTWWILQGRMHRRVCVWGGAFPANASCQWEVQGVWDYGEFPRNAQSQWEFQGAWECGPSKTNTQCQQHLIHILWLCYHAFNAILILCIFKMHFGIFLTEHVCLSLQVFLSVRPPGPAHEEAHLRSKRRSGREERERGERRRRRGRRDRKREQGMGSRAMIRPPHSPRL